MRGKCLVPLALTAGLLSLAAADLLGCGDKFVVLGRGVRFQRITMSVHPASILIYSNPASRLPAADKKLQFQATLKLAGHKPAVVEDARSLGRVLTTAKYDLVLADISDASMLEAEMRAAPSKPAVIPVISDPTGSGLAETRRRYGCAIKATASGHDLLAVIDQAMASRSKGAEPSCPQTQ